MKKSARRRKERRTTRSAPSLRRKSGTAPQARIRRIGRAVASAHTEGSTGCRERDGIQKIAAAISAASASGVRQRIATSSTSTHRSNPLPNSTASGGEIGAQEGGNFHSGTGKQR